MEVEGGSARGKHKIFDLRKDYCFNLTQTFLANTMVVSILQEVDQAADLAREVDLLEIVENAAVCLRAVETKAVHDISKQGSVFGSLLQVPRTEEAAHTDETTPKHDA